METINELIFYLKSKKNVWLYGAGKISRRLILLAKKNNIEINGIIVTERNSNPYELNGIRVYTVREIQYMKMQYKDLNVVVSFLTSKHKSFDKFVEYKFASVLFLTQGLYKQLQLMEIDESRQLALNDIQSHYNQLQNENKLDATSDYLEPGQGVLYDNCTGEPFVRFPALDVGMLEALMKYGNKESTFEQLGRWEYLPHSKDKTVSDKVAEEKKIEIYIITSHYDNMILNEQTKLPKVYIPLQVGAYYTDKRKGCLIDYSGDNISSKNKDYSECTGLYWIWKNTDNQNYVGLNHYRRRLMIDDGSVDYLENNNIDVVVALPQLEVYSIKDFLTNYYISQFDWDILKTVIAKEKPEWDTVFEKFEKGHFYYPCNVCLWKREWFDEYCKFAFSVAEIIENENALRGLYRNDRYMGYLFECMSTIFIMANETKLNVACTEIAWTE